MAKDDKVPASLKAALALDSLDKMTFKELNELALAVDAKRQEKQGVARAEMLAKWREEALEAGLSPDELFASLQAQPARKTAASDKGERPKLAAKYRNAEGNEWSGRGKAPRWMTEAEAGGKKRDDFLIVQP